MAKCEFELPLQLSPADLISRASASFTQAGGTFNGTEQGGTFSISTPLGILSGSYEMNGAALRISTTEKPLLIGCKRIREELTKRLF